MFCQATDKPYSRKFAVNAGIIANPAFYIPWVMAFVTFPMIFLPIYTFDASFEPEPANTVLALAAYSVFFLTALLRLKRSKEVYRYFYSQDVPFILFITACIASSTAQGLPLSVLNTILLFMVFVSVRVASFEDLFLPMLISAFAVCLSFLVISQIILGPPVNRWLGGIHPNVYGAAIIAAMALSTFTTFFWINSAFFVCLFCAVSVSSRYAMVGSFIIYATFCVINYKKTGVVQFLLILSAILFAVYDVAAHGTGGTIGSALMLNSADRGLSSGMTGRDQHWAHFFPQLLERPLFGYGFRNRSSFYGPHNGFLSLILECGIVGSSLMFSFLMIRIENMRREVVRLRTRGLKGKLLATTIAIMLIVNLQPQLINFGDAMEFLIILVLFSRPSYERSLASKS